MEAASPDRVLGALASAQHGLVARPQALAAGLTSKTIEHRLRTGVLRRRHRGVYAVGHEALRVEATWLAAVLAAGPGATLSHASAAAAWDLAPLGRGPVEVTVGRGGRIRRAGLSLHRARGLAPDERTVHRGVPLTTPERTLLDLAARVGARELQRILDSAQRLGLLDVQRLRMTLTRHGAVAGAPVLAELLDAYDDAPTRTRSELEQRFLRLCTDRGIPPPVVNGRLLGYEVDAHWPAAKLVVELDGYAFHRSPSAFEADRARDVALALAGWTVVRFTWRQLRDAPADTATAILRLLCSP